MSKAAEKRWECFATLHKEMNALADEIIELSEDGHYRDRLIQLYDLADTVFGAKNVKRLLAALEKSQRANAAQADHINQQQDRIDTLERRNGEIGKYARGLEQRLQQPIRQLHAEWSDKTFGLPADVGPVGPLEHLAQEAIEAAENPADLHEWADIQFLFWDALRRAGISDQQLNQAMIEKLAVNKAREWPEPKDGEPRLHIKGE